MFRKVFIAVFVLLLASGLTHAGDKKVIVGTSADYPPFEWVDGNGNFVGFDMDVVRMLGHLKGFKVEIKDIPFDSLITSLKTGKVDIIAAALSVNEERAKVVDFTDAYYDAETAILVRKVSKLSIATLFQKGRKIGAQTGGTQAQWLEEQLKTGAQFEAKMYETNDLAIMDIGAGRLDALVTDSSGANAFASVSPVKVIGIVVTGTKTAMAVQKGDPKGLGKMINEGFKELQEKGVWDELLAAYFVAGDLKRITKCYGKAKGLFEKGDLLPYSKALKECMAEK